MFSLLLSIIIVDYFILSLHFTYKNNNSVLYYDLKLFTGLQSLSEGCTELNEFYFNKCEKITDQGLEYLSKGMFL